MRTKRIFQIDDHFIGKALSWASELSHCMYLNPNSQDYPYGAFKHILAAGNTLEASDTLHSFDILKKTFDENKDWLFGYFSYDLKNQVENLSSNNMDRTAFPEMQFFSPKHLLKFTNHEVEIESVENPEVIFEKINTLENTSIDNPGIDIKHHVSIEEYISTVNHIREHIKNGDVYEMNYCIEFYAEKVNINPVDTYERLNNLSPMPFSSFLKINTHYLLCASPERFLKKEGTKLISQPIKGTAKRGTNLEQDKIIKDLLHNSLKERAENIMIVDLVRNDLAKTTLPGSVKVEELCEIYSFRQVHQMISTITAEIEDNTHFIDSIKTSFPMGSMTGAPKVRAMELIERYEKSKRSIFSGAVGYITPAGDFDFNVVIRSILYNASNNNLSFFVGSAITYESDAIKEYEECFLKADAIFKVLKNSDTPSLS